MTDRPDTRFIDLAEFLKGWLLPVLKAAVLTVALTLDVLGQAAEWRRSGAAHRVVVLVPAPLRHWVADTPGRHLAYRVAAWLGLGVATLRLRPGAEAQATIEIIR